MRIALRLLPKQQVTKISLNYQYPLSAAITRFCAGPRRFMQTFYMTAAMQRPVDETVHLFQAVESRRQKKGRDSEGADLAHARV